MVYQSRTSIVLLISILFLSCQVPVPMKSGSDTSAQDPTSLAARYADAVELAYETYSVDQPSGRETAATKPNALTYYFDELPIHNDSGEPVKFSSLSSTQRKAFFLGWKRATAEAMGRAINASSEGTQELADILASFDHAITANNSVSGDFSTFWGSYNANYEARRGIRSVNPSARSGGSAGNWGPDTVYWEGFYQLRNAYKQGNIIASDTIGVSPMGHASMFSEPTWDTKWDRPVLGAPGAWEINKTARISITSSPSTGSKEYYDAYGLQAPAARSNLFYWGVSYEQLFCWVTNNTWIKHVKVFKPGYRDWSLLGDGTWHEASDADRARAVSNAQANFEKEYNTDWGDRDRTDRFYCSQIVWRAWYDIDTKYNFCPPLLPPGTGIAPNIMMTSSNLSSVADWNMNDVIPYLNFSTLYNGDEFLDKIRITPSGYASAGIVEVSLGSANGNYAAWQRLSDSEAQALYWQVSRVNSPGTQNKNSPAAVSSNGRLDAIVVGLDDELYQETSLDGGTTWNSHRVNAPGVKIKNSPAVASTNGRLDLFILGLDDELYQETSNDGSTWTYKRVNAPGTKVKNSPAVVSANGRLDVIVVGLDDELYQETSLNGGLTWSLRKLNAPGTKIKNSPAIASINGRLEVFNVGLDDELYQQTSLDGSAWTYKKVFAPGTKVKASPSVVAVEGRLDVITVGLDDELYQASSISGGPWSYRIMNRPGTKVQNSPAVVSLGQEQFAFTLGLDNELYMVRRGTLYLPQ